MIIFCNRLVKVLLLLLFAQTLQGQVVTLSEGGNTAVEGNLRYFRDETKVLSIEQLVPDKFIPAKAGSPNLGFDRAAHWFSFELKNTSSKSDWLMEVAFAPLDHIDFFIEADSGQWEHFVAGDTLPMSNRTLRHRHPLINFSIESGHQKKVFIRTQTISSVQVPIILWQRDVFFRDNYHLQLLNGLFYGAMLTMALYQLFLFFSIRDRVTFYYVMTLFSMVNVVSFYQGYHFLYFHPEHPEINDWFAMFSGPFFVTCSSLLTRSFLNLRQYSKWLDSLVLLNMSGNILTAVIMAIFYRQVSYGYHHFFTLMHCGIVLVASGYCLYKKFLPSRYYLFAWVSPLLAAGSFTVSNLGFAPGFLGTNYTILMIGCVLQMLFISFALGDRLNSLVRENAKARELEIERERSEKERLERIVQERTNEISLKNEKLEEVNRVKDKLFSIVSHDIRAPLASLQSVLNLVKVKRLDAEEFKEVSEELARQLGKTNEFTANLLQWAKLQLKGERFELDILNMNQLISKTIELIEPEARIKNLSILNRVELNARVEADENMIMTVVRNLLVNAIKFTPINGDIIISSLVNQEQVAISVTDTGVGIPHQNLVSLFTLNSVTTLGTQQEKGTGLGLMLCKEYIEKNNGRIWVESQEGKGTTFSFSLPKPK